MKPNPPSLQRIRSIKERKTHEKCRVKTRLCTGGGDSLRGRMLRYAHLSIVFFIFPLVCGRAARDHLDELVSTKDNAGE